MLDIVDMIGFYYLLCNVMKYRKILINIMHIFHSHENILIFSRERNRKIGTTFYYFLNMV